MPDQIESLKDLLQELVRELEDQKATISYTLQEVRTLKPITLQSVIDGKATIALSNKTDFDKLRQRIAALKINSDKV